MCPSLEIDLPSFLCEEERLGERRSPILFRKRVPTNQEFVQPPEMERAVLIEALIGSKALLHTGHCPLGNRYRVGAPAEHRRDVLDLLLATGESRKELLCVQQFG